MQLPHAVETNLRQKLAERGISLSPLLARTLDQVKVSHGNQRRDDGSPFLEQHIYPMAIDVVDSCGGVVCPENLLAGALLHDVLEDDETMTEDKFIDLFGQEIYSIVKPVTLSKAENNPSMPEDLKRARNEQKLRDIIAFAPTYSKIIRLADRANNLASCQSIKESNPVRYQRYVDETREVYLPFVQLESAYFYRRLGEILAWLENQGEYDEAR